MGTSKPPAGPGRTLKDWLAQDGAPWRPFDDGGTLVKPQRTPRTQSALFAECERLLVSHLKAVCLWSERQRDKTWRIGDFSFYILEFSPAPGTEVYAQFWSEPLEDGVILEVSSGAWSAPVDQYVDADKRELLRDHGLELSGNKSNFGKTVLLTSAKEARAVARETVAILCKVLGYDGRVPLTFRLHLGTRLEPGLAFDTICASDLAKLMRQWGFTADIDEHDGKPNLIRSAVGEQPFLVAFVGERPEGSNQYGMIGLRAFLRFAGGVPDGLVNAINQNFVLAKASVDEDGDLIVQTPILLHGGVTEANLAMSFQIWQQTIEEIVRGLE